MGMPSPGLGGRGESWPWKEVHFRFKVIPHKCAPCSMCQEQAESGPRGAHWRFSIGGGHPRRGAFPGEARTQGVLGFVTHEGSSRPPPCPGLSTTTWLSGLQHPPQECMRRPLREGALWAALCTALSQEPWLRSGSAAVRPRVVWPGLRVTVGCLVCSTPGV